MKFQVRDGFALHVLTQIDLGDGRTESQTSSHYSGQRLDLTTEQAEGHAHKLAPLDAEATAWLAAKVAPQAPEQTLGLTAEALALVQAMAAEVARQVLAVAPAVKGKAKADPEPALV